MDPGCAELSFRAFGVTARFVTNDMGIMAQLPAYLPYGWKPIPARATYKSYVLMVDPGKLAKGEGGAYSFSIDGTRISRDDPQELLDLFERDLRIIIAEGARDRIFMHAGVVGWHGRAIVIPGRSLAGKTSLVAELVRRGARYYSDEYAVLDSRGHVHPFATPLQIRSDEGLQVRRPVEELGGRAGKKALPVGLVILTNYAPGARWRPKRLSPARAVLAMLEHTAPARSRPHEVLDVLQTVATRALVVTGARGEAADVAPRVLELTGG